MFWGGLFDGAFRRRLSNEGREGDFLRLSHETPRELVDRDVLRENDRDGRLWGENDLARCVSRLDRRPRLKAKGSWGSECRFRLGGGGRDDGDRLRCSRDGEERRGRCSPVEDLRRGDLDRL